MGSSETKFLLKNVKAFNYCTFVVFNLFFTMKIAMEANEQTNLPGKNRLQHESHR